MEHYYVLLITMESKLLLAPIYRWGIQDIERLSNFPKVTELVSDFSKTELLTLWHYLKVSGI